MTSVTDAPENPLPFGRSRSRRVGSGRVIGWLRANLFPSIPSSVISLLLIFLLAKAGVSFVQWGLLERDLDGYRQSDQRLSGDPWNWRLLGRYSREISLHSVRYVSLRSAVATRPGDPDIHRTLLRVEPTADGGARSLFWCGSQRWP